MKKDKQRFEILFENNPHPTWVFDLETLRFLEVNRAAIRNYGYSREEFLAMRITDIRPQGDVQSLLEEIKTLPPEVLSSERRHMTKNGRVFPVAASAHLAELNGRKVAVVVAEDITARLQARELLVRSKEEAEQATRFKDQFLSTMSHELRTPLNAILGFSELVSDERYGPLNDRQRRYIDHIHNSGKHLLRLINDMLDLSKIEAGRLELLRETVEIDKIFADAITVMRTLAERKSHALFQQADERVRVSADPTRLKQVLLNLIGNAIKFTPQGGRIQLAAIVDNGQVRIEVHDTGPGIPAEEQGKILEAFYRMKCADQGTEGTGLGLAITQKLVRLHGGELQVKSEMGAGSCFYFSLPAIVEKAPEAQTEISETAPERDNPIVLVVEDDRDTAELIRSQLGSAGYEVVWCPDPRSVRKMAAELQPNAITLDLHMKPMNGWEVLLALKGDRQTRNIPVIVLTIIDQSEMGAILGADEYLVKPVKKAVLLEAVERVIRAHGGVRPNRQILVVEDDAPTREMISELLRRSGYEVRTACDGQQARESVEASLPALVILDLLLPKVGGFDLIAEWRRSHRTVDLPICVLTSKDLTQHETKYLRANAESLIQKQPNWQEALLKQLQRVVPQHQLETA